MVEVRGRRDNCVQDGVVLSFLFSFRSVVCDEREKSGGCGNRFDRKHGSCNSCDNALPLNRRNATPATGRHPMWFVLFTTPLQPFIELFYLPSKKMCTARFSGTTISPSKVKFLLRMQDLIQFRYTRFGIQSCSNTVMPVN